MYLWCMRISNELQIGKAGEYIVCADLIMKGFVAFPSEQGLPYDVLLDIGHKLIRVQVKTTTAPRLVPQRSKPSQAYVFAIKRAGKNNKRLFVNGDVDLFALVCLDTRKVGYLLPDNTPTTINFRVDSLKGTYYDEKGIIDHKRISELKSSLTQTQIAKEMGLHIAAVNRMVREDYKPYETGARYFSDIERERDWFTAL